MIVLPRFVRAIWGSDSLLHVLGLMMNSLVVEVVSGSEGGGGGGVTRHMSDAALQGFCHLHHL